MSQQDDTLEPEVHALAQTLLDSAASDVPPSELHRSVAAAVGIGTAATTSAAHGAELAQGLAAAANTGVEIPSVGLETAIATSVAGGAKPATVTAALGGSVKWAPLLALWKWAAGGFFVATVAVGGLKFAERTKTPTEQPAPGSRVRPQFARVAAGASAEARAAARSSVENRTERAPDSAVDTALPPRALPGPTAPQTPSNSGPDSGPGFETRTQLIDRDPDGQHTRAFMGARSEPPPLAPAESRAAAPGAGPSLLSPAAQRQPTPRALDDALAGEVRLLDNARVHTASGRLGPTLTALNQYHSSYPTGVLRAEALALTVDVWLRAGNEPEARRWVQVLERAFPTSQHLERFAGLRTGAQPKGGAQPSPETLGRLR